MHRCKVCNGRGVKVTLRQLGPGMVQQMQSICPDCHGEGMVINYVIVVAYFRYKFYIKKAKIFTFIFC